MLFLYNSHIFSNPATELGLNLYGPIHTGIIIGFPMLAM